MASSMALNKPRGVSSTSTPAPSTSTLLPRSARQTAQPRAVALIMSALTLRPPSKTLGSITELALLPRGRGLAPTMQAPSAMQDVSPMRALPQRRQPAPARGPQAAWVEAEVLSLTASFDEMLAGFGNEMCLPDMGQPMARN